MTRIASTLVVATLVGIARAMAQFEGIVESRNFTVDDNGVGQQFDMTIWLRRDMIKVKVPAIGEIPGSTVIYRHDRKVSWVINDADKSYFEVSLAEQMMGHGQGDQSPDKPKVDRTKRTRKLLGYQCEQIVLRRGESETEIWGAKGLGDLAARMDSLLGDAADRSTGGETEIMKQLQRFPLVSITRINGKVVDSQEVTKIDRRNLDPGIFVIPPGYKKQTSMEPMRTE
jgi:hypothetical protein